MPRTTRTQLSLILTTLICSQYAGFGLACFADKPFCTTDWTQWGGPNQDFSVSPIAGFASLPKPELGWERELGKGHAAIVCRGPFGFSVHLDGEHEVLQKFQLENGKPIWNFRYKVDFHAPYSKYDGPHSTPLILSDRIIITSIDAQVHAIDVDSGTPIWKRDLCSDYGTVLPQSGYASSPIAWNDRIILPTIGESRASETERYDPDPRIPSDREPIPGAVALDIKTGKEVWRTKTFRTSHGSPLLVEVENQSMIVIHGMFELLGIAPESGSILWKHVLRRTAADNVSFTPIWDADRSQFLLSHGYCNLGTQAIELKKVGGIWQTKVNWNNNRLQIVHTNAVLVGDILVGTKRPSATLMVGIDVNDGRTVFRQRGFGKSNFLTVGEQTLVLEEDGDLMAVRVTESGVDKIWNISALSESAWTAPTITGEMLLLRDSSKLKAYRFR